MREILGMLALVLLAATPGAAEWKLVWSDEFNQAGAPDPSRWNFEYGFVRNRERQFYTQGRKENARVENGILIIEARQERFAIPGSSAAAKSGSKGRPGRGGEYAE